MTRRGWALAGAAAVLCACASQPDQGLCNGIIDVPRSAGHMEGAAWVLGEWNGTGLVHYPAFASLRIAHGLGRIPTDVRVFASFSPTGGVFAQQIGNVVEIVPSCGATSEFTAESVLLRNAAAQEFWVRIIVE